MAANEARVRSFPPALGRQPRALVLGSMPGVASLRAGEYYAHPRNAFWPLMQSLFGVPADAPYGQRVAQLNECGIGLWDVLAECERPGSLDAAIAPDSIRVNPIAALIDAHPCLRVIALNGGAAARLFDRYVAPSLDRTDDGLVVLRLPSTSPAHAARSFAQKQESWRALARAVGGVERRAAASRTCA